jgi:hypothetical protein
MDRAKPMKPWQAAGRLGVVVLVLGLAACGSLHATTTGTVGGATSPVPSTTPGSPGVTPPGGAAGSAALCQAAGTVTGLRIVREGTVRPVPASSQAVIPNEVTVSRPAEVRAVARALCALPVMPKAVFSCPAGWNGTTYKLYFTASGRSLPTVEVEATACETISGVGPVRWAPDRPGFWRVLATAVGVNPPGQSAFSGVQSGTTCQPPSTRLHSINGCPGQAKPGGAAEPGGVAKPGGADKPVGMAKPGGAAQPAG